MILINLLPPELRKRTSSGLSPVFMGAVAGGLVILLALAGFAWLQFVRLPNAERELAAHTDELAEKTARATAVEALEAQIQEFEKRRDDILTLINRKIYWAHTLDEFAGLLTGQWSVEGFKVNAQDLALAELPAQGKKQEEVRYSFRWRYKLLGDEDRSGDYINSFFKTIERSPFWTVNGFVDKPDSRYDGDRPRWNADLQKVVVEGTLDWQRLKVALKPVAKPAPAVVAQGN
jgi:Tfp pilus assembly protein PilN